MPLTITIVSPDVDETPGSAGAFAADYTTAINTAIVVEITGSLFEVVTAQFPDSSKPSGFSDEVCVYRDGDFRQGFTERSSEASITDGKRLTILPDGHWPGTTALHDVRLNVDGVEGSAAYTVDATNGLPVPKTMGEFQALMDEIGVTGYPSHGYLFGDQLAGGTVPDLAGVKDLTQVQPTDSFNVGRSGWASKFMHFVAGADGLYSNATFSNVNSNPYLAIFRAAIDSSAATRTLFTMGDTFDDDVAVEVQATPRMQLGEGFGSGRKLGTADPIAGADVMTFVALVDPVTWRTCLLYTSQERISAVFGGTAAAGNSIKWGGDNNQTWFPPTMDLLDGWIFTGSAARKTSEEIRKLVEILDGVNPTWRSWNMIKTGATTNYDAGASSVETFAGDVYTECMIGVTGSGEMAMGLSDTDVDANYTSIDFGFLHDNGNVYRIEAGVATLHTTAASGDVLRVARESTTMKLYKNGALSHTFGTTTAAALRVDCSIRIQNSVLPMIRAVVGGVEQTLTWQNVVAVAVF